MANTKSAIKRMKQSEKRRQRNRADPQQLRSTVKAAGAALSRRRARGQGLPFGRPSACSTAP